MAFLIADNRLTENSSWDERMLGEQLKILSALELDFDLETIGFEALRSISSSMASTQCPRPIPFYPLPAFCPFLSTAAAAFWAVKAA
jgi:hypothetical protein